MLLAHLPPCLRSLWRSHRLSGHLSGPLSHSDSVVPLRLLFFLLPRRVSSCLARCRPVSFRIWTGNPPCVWLGISHRSSRLCTRGIGPTARARLYLACRYRPLVLLPPVLVEGRTSPSRRRRLRTSWQMQLSSLMHCRALALQGYLLSISGVLQTISCLVSSSLQC